MSEFVRVRLENGHEVSLAAVFVEGTSLQVLDEPATDLRGRPLGASRMNGRPMKPKTTVAKEAAKKKAVARMSDPGPSDVYPTGGDAAVTPEEAQ